MIFESLSDKLQTAMKNLRGKGKLNEQDIDVAMREVRLALLEADVNFRVVKDFVNRIKERAKGAEVMESLTPGQMVVKIVNEELTALMGKKRRKTDTRWKKTRRYDAMRPAGCRKNDPRRQAGHVAEKAESDPAACRL